MCRIRYFPEKICRRLSSSWRNPEGKSSATVLAKKQLSNNFLAIDLSAWIAGNPVDVLATNFGKPTSVFEKFPRKDIFISPNQ
jgi:hypothetical protein